MPLKYKYSRKDCIRYIYIYIYIYIYACWNSFCNFLINYNITRNPFFLYSWELSISMPQTISYKYIWAWLFWWKFFFFNKCTKMTLLPGIQFTQAEHKRNHFLFIPWSTTILQFLCAHVTLSRSICP